MFALISFGMLFPLTEVCVPAVDHVPYFKNRCCTIYRVIMFKWPDHTHTYIQPVKCQVLILLFYKKKSHLKEKNCRHFFNLAWPLVAALWHAPLFGNPYSKIYDDDINTSGVWYKKELPLYGWIYRCWVCVLPKGTVSGNPAWNLTAVPGQRRSSRPACPSQRVCVFYWSLRQSFLRPRLRLERRVWPLILTAPFFPRRTAKL